MQINDLFQLGLSNLWKTKLRAFLTILGVTIGIGALVSMVSFGTGMQKNVTDYFKKNDLFTSIQVIPQKIDINEVTSRLERGRKENQQDVPPLNSQALDSIRSIQGVYIAFPEISFPVMVRFNDRETRTYLKGIPAELGKHKPFNELLYGDFYQDGTQENIIIDTETLESLGIKLTETAIDTAAQNSKEVTYVPSDSVIGKKITIVTSVIDPASVTSIMGMGKTDNSLFKKEQKQFTIIGIRKREVEFSYGYYRGGVIAPIKTAEKMPRLPFNSVWSLLNSMDNESEYGALLVRVESVDYLKSVRNKIEELGFGTISIADQLEEFKKGFIIMDTALGAIGTIALIVAGLGIINTMVMSILERTREIGIMKAVGGSEFQIKSIFFFEAGSIGLLGGLFGLALGWIVTKIAGAVATYYIIKQGGETVDFFYIPGWLVISALVFSIVISLIAGIYPAIRAARINPVEALRHD
ncbi:MAG: FtsX-like permease family protein [bacterium]